MSVFASVNRGNGSSYVYDSIFLWVEDVKYDRFKACVVEGGQEAGDNFCLRTNFAKGKILLRENFC